MSWYEKKTPEWKAEFARQSREAQLRWLAERRLLESYDWANTVTAARWSGSRQVVTIRESDGITYEATLPHGQELAVGDEICYIELSRRCDERDPMFVRGEIKLLRVVHPRSR